MSDTIKAGRYQLVSARFDQQTSKPNDPFTFKRFVRGEVVTLDAEDAERLLRAGAVVEEGALEKADAEAKLAAAVAALQLLPDEIRNTLTAGVLGQDDDEEAATVSTELEELRTQLAEAQAALAATQSGGDRASNGADGGLERPAKAADKALWVAFAKSKGADPTWADDPETTKPQLIERYGA
jgi:hypothetical protein